MGTSPNLCYIPGPDPPTNSAGGNREEQQDRTSNIIQFELGWNPHGSKGFSRLALRIENLISNPDPSTTWVHLHRTQTGPGLSPRRKKPQADGGASVSDTRQTIRAEDSLIKDTKKAERNQEGRGKK